MSDYQDELRDIEKDIAVWRSDEKWNNKTQVNIKKKKVFEIKWFTRVLKKRAGIKKQAILEQKKFKLKK